MSESSVNPFASPGASAKRQKDVTSRSGELRSVSFSGRLNDEEAHILSGRKTIHWIDSILLIPVVFVVAATIYQLTIYGSRGPDFDMVFFFCITLGYSVFLWWISKVQFKQSWQKANSRGTFSRDQLSVYFDDCEINIVLAEHKIHIDSQGIRIELGKSIPLSLILISRHWFLPNEFEIACEIIQESKPIPIESLQSFPIVAECPTTSIPFYQLDQRRRSNNVTKQLFGLWLSVPIGISLLLFGSFSNFVRRVSPTFDIADQIVPFAIFALGICLLFGFGIARFKIHRAKHFHRSTRTDKNNLQGWIDSNGIATLTKHGIVRSGWTEQMHYIPFTDSINLFCILLQPRTMGLFPDAFETRGDWLQAKSIIESNLSTAWQIARQNSGWWLKLRALNRVR